MFDITGHSMAQTILDRFCAGWSHIFIGVGTAVTHLICLDETLIQRKHLFYERFVLDGAEYITLHSIWKLNVIHK